MSENDGSSIQDKDQLLRRIPYMNPDFIKENGQITSLAFKLKTGEDGISVDLERLTTHAKSISDKQRFRLYRIQVAQVKAIGLDCIADPDPVNNNPAHSLIVGEHSKQTAKSLATSAQRVPYPD